MHNRQSALNKWLKNILATSEFSLTPLTGDASFRRYYRLHYANVNRIIMDAPPTKEALQAFLDITSFLYAHKLKTPQIHAVDKIQGFAILDDFGDILLLNKLSSDTADSLYKSAIDNLITLQNCPLTAHSFPDFDTSFMLSELQVFNDWFIQSYLKLSLAKKDEALIESSFSWLTEEIAKQPRLLIHRDYHSRNIMLIDDGTMGIIDFQDAMIGPFTYDLVSLLKDCYVQWPRSVVMQWISYFYAHSPIAQQWSFTDFIRAFDLCGLQRHLKVLGVFSRLYLRDNKPNYLNDLPLTLHYVMACLESYPELNALYQFMQKVQLP